MHNKPEKDVAWYKKQFELFEDVQTMCEAGGWELDLKTGMTSWSKQVYVIHGLSPDETQLNKVDALSFYAEHEIPRLMDMLDKAQKNKEPFDDIFEFYDAQKNKKWVRSIGRAVADSNGEVAKLTGTFQDVTSIIEQRKKIEETNTYLDLALEGAGLGIWDWYFEDDRVQYDRRWCEMLGLDIDKIKMDLSTWQDNCHPDDVPKCFEEINKYLNGEIDVYEVKIRMKHVDGHWVHIMARGRLSSWDSQGNPTRFTGTHLDISMEMNQQEKLKETNTYLDLALEGAGLGVWDWYLTDNSVRFDQRWAEMLGLDVNEISMELSTWESRVHPDDLPDCYADIKKYMNGKTDYYENIHRMKHSDGRWVYILDRGRFSEFNEKGEPTRFTGTHLDITASEEAKKKRLAEVENVLSATPSCLKIINKNGKLIQMNDQGLGLVEAENFAEVDQACVYDLIAEDHRENFKAFNKRICGGETGTLTFEIVGLKGTRRWMETYAAPFSIEGGEICHIAITNDVTEKVKSRIELDRQKRIAMRNSKLASIGELAAGVGHEINNPLAVAKGYLFKMNRQLKDLGDEQAASFKDGITKIDKSLESVAEIVRGLRSFARTESAVGASFNPVDALEESVGMVREIYKKDGIGVSVDVSKINKNLSCVGHRSRLQQVFMNLLSNAKDAVGQEEDKRIDISFSYDSSKLKIHFKDNGCGMKPGQIDKIFDPFYTTKELHKGTGIGLSLVHNIMDEFDGHIHVESKEGEGTEFILEFPVLIGTSKSKANEKSVVEASAILHNGNILLAEDEIEIREILEEYLTENGFNVTAVENGAKALKVLTESTESFDLVISDIKMPELNGDELVFKIRDMKDIKQPKVILLTGGVGFNLEDESLPLVNLIDGCLYKPFQMEKILPTIDQVFKGKKDVA